MRQYCRPHGVTNLSSVSTISRETALIAHASPRQRKESVDAAARSMDGINGLGPKVDVSLLPTDRGRGWWSTLPAEVTRGRRIACRHEHRRSAEPGGTCRPPCRPSAEGQR